MKTLVWGLGLLISAGLSACNTNAEFACVKYPTPESRAECVQRQRQVMDDFKKQHEKEEKSQRATEKEAPVKPNNLCFKRESTGEQVCPN